MWPIWYFATDANPREPFTDEMTKLPPRSKYYEVFLATWTFAASGILISSVEYFVSDRIRLPKKCKTWVVDTLQFLVLVAPFEMCTVDYPVAKYWHVVAYFNGFCCVVCGIASLHRRLCGVSNDHDLLEVADDAELANESESSATQQKQMNQVASYFRSVVYICTALCIFARDQSCWRNNFSKTYSFGTGLMDIGIGCFVFCIGALGPTSARRIDEVDKSASMRKCLFQFGILSTCGVVKAAIVVAQIRYHQITFEQSWMEYGVHWNAFFTLAVAKLAGTWLELRLLPAKLPPLAAAWLLQLLHELLMLCCLANYVLAPGKIRPHNRSNLIGQNREGLSSAPGVVALYFVGLQVGRWCKDRSQTGLWRLAIRLSALLMTSLMYRVALFSAGAWVLPESRRLFNASYCQWVTAFASFCLLNACLLVRLRRHLRCRGHVRHARLVDSVGLLYFLVSNLLTGVFNFFIDHAYRSREAMSGTVCYGVVLIYMAVSIMTARLLSTRIDFNAAFRACFKA